MDAKTRQGYEKLIAELGVMHERLKYLSDAGYDDMEGADQPEFSLSEEIYCLKETAKPLHKTITRMQELLK